MEMSRGRERVTRLVVAFALVASTFAVVGTTASAPSAGAALDTGRIAMSVFDSGFCWVATMNPDGSDLALLQTGNDPVFSPDGTRIAYWFFNGSILQVAVMDADGANVTIVGEGGFPTWSPDGTALALVRTVLIPNGGGVGTPALFRVPLDGSPEVQLTHPELVANGLTGDGSPSWSPDGTNIVFSRGSATTTPPFTRSDLYSVSISDGTLTQLTSEPVPTPDPTQHNLVADTPVYSPDGTQIAYTAFYRNPSRNLFDERRPYVVGSGGGTGAMVWNLPDGIIGEDLQQAWGSPGWSPDGTLVYLRDMGVHGPPGYQVVTSGGAVLFVTPGTTCVRTLSWASATGDDRPPTASIVPTKITEGRYFFDGTGSIDPEGLPLAYDWDFDNGVTDTAAARFVDFTKPGAYDVRLTVIDRSGESDTTTVHVEVAAPALDVSVRLFDTSGLPLASGDLEVGDEFLARASATATSDGVGALSELAFDGNMLQWSPGDRLELVNALPDPPDPFSLEPGEPKDLLEARFRILTVGRATLTSSISGVDAAGEDVTGGETATLVTSVLRVSIIVTPEDLVVHDTDVGLDGHPAPHPEPVKAIVRVENPLDVPVHLVQLRPSITGPPPQYLGIRSLDPATTVKDLVLLSGPAEGVAIGTIGPGEHVDRTFALEARDNGNYQVDVVLTAADPAFPDPTLAPTVPAEAHADVHIGADYLLYFEIEPDVSLLDRTNGLVRTGQKIPIRGIVRNRDQGHVLELEPLTPALTGNAGNGNPVDQSRPVPDDIYPVPLRGELAADQTILFHGELQTIEGGSTRLTVRYTPKAKIVETNGTKRDLKPSEIKLVPVDVHAEGVTSTVVDGGIEIEIHLDDRVIPPDPVDYLTLLGEYTAGFAKGSATWLSGTLTGIWYLIKSIPGFLAKYNTPVLLWQTIEYMARVWESLGPAEKDQFFNRIVSGIVLQTGEEFDKVHAAVDAQVSSYFNRLLGGFYGGDPRQTAFMFGEISGQVSLEAATWYLQESKAGTILKELATEAKIGTHLGDLLADGVRRLGGTWPLNTATMGKLWGVTERGMTNLGKLAKEKNLLISIKARGAESLKWIEEFKAVLKPEKIKLKNVDEMDTRWLGYAEDDLGRVIVKEDLLSEAELAENLSKAGLDATSPEWIAAFKRHGTRTKELTSDAEGYVKYLKARAEKGRLDVGFNYRDNFGAGVANELPTVRDFRNFKMPPIEGRPGSFEVLLEDSGGVLRSVTGDVDIIAITKADGSFLTTAERLEVYQILQEMPDVNILHPETMTWLKGGTRRVGTSSPSTWPGARVTRDCCCSSVPTRSPAPHTSIPT